MSSVNINRKVTCCQTSAKHGQREIKIGTLTTFRMRNSNMALLTPSLTCQTSTKQIAKFKFT